MTQQERQKPHRLGLLSPLSLLSGIGPKRAAALKERGLVTAADALFHIPSRYQDWRELKALHELRPGMIVTVRGELSALDERPMPGNRWRRLVSGWISDESGNRIRVIWFNLRQGMRERMPARQRVLAYGRVSAGPDGIREMAHPELHPLASGPPPAVRPIYSLPAQVPQRLFAKLVTGLLDELSEQIKGALPDDLQSQVGLPPLGEALRRLHCPLGEADVGKLQSGASKAHSALALDEMFAFQLALCIERARAVGRPSVVLDGISRLTDAFVGGLPFDFTPSQRRAIDEVARDMARPRQMNRILIGDVGSGKTVIALWAALRAIESGYQVAMMAPTELLAEQHHQTFSRLCASLKVRNALLSRKVAGAERAAVLKGLASGEIPLVFGTHALIQREVRLRELALAVIDEQHRFGVFDRARLKALGPRAHMLLMTATPIPRSLALTLFANLDVSSLEEQPPGRRPVITELFTENESDRVDALVRDELQAGNRAYYVLPLIEGQDEDSPSVLAMARRLSRGNLRGFRIGVMHGRMRSEEKDGVMRDFRDGALDVLVATTLIEVGIDVPEATIMVIENAERYGLAQLHQLRGRVGRGGRQSRCCLVISADADLRARQRVEVMVRCSSGADIARADLEMRGPGDLLGARQAGPLPLKFVEFIRDAALIEQARRLAEEWLRRDPELESEGSSGARAALRRMLELGFSMGDIG